MSKFQISQSSKRYLFPFYIAVVTIAAQAPSAISAPLNSSMLGKEKGTAILEAQANTISTPALPVQSAPSLNQLNQSLDMPIQQASPAQPTTNTPVLTPTVPVIPPPGTSNLPQQPTPNQIQFPFNPPHIPRIDNNFNSVPVAP